MAKRHYSRTPAHIGPEGAYTGQHEKDALLQIEVQPTLFMAILKGYIDCIPPGIDTEGGGGGGGPPSPPYSEQNLFFVISIEMASALFVHPISPPPIVSVSVPAHSPPAPP